MSSLETQMLALGGHGAWAAWPPPKETLQGMLRQRPRRKSQRVLPEWAKESFLNSDLGNNRVPEWAKESAAKKAPLLT